MKKLNLILTFCAGLLVFASCSSDDGDDASAEYYNWQARNEAYFENVFQQASDEISAGSTEWYQILSYSKNNTDNHSNYIVVNVLEQGKDKTGNAHIEIVDGTKNTLDGQCCPIWGDTCKVTYRGNMIPSNTYSTVVRESDGIEVGYQFDTKWYGDDLVLGEALYSSLTPSGLVDGFATALLYMHPGDRWRVYIPYQLGYGSSGSGNVQAYSTLIFDIYLDSFKTQKKKEQ